MFHAKKHLFFDLDHTLWDYETCSDETLDELWESHRLASLGIPRDDFKSKFSEVNAAMWAQFDKGLITKDAIRGERFPKIFESFQVNNTDTALKIQTEYINICPTKPHLIDGARELLEAIIGKYELYIITNGFEEIQGTKMKSGGLEKYFRHVISSGLVGYQKPDREIFEYALNLAGATANDVLMIGDNPISDIEGAARAGIDQVFLNPNGLQCAITPTLEIKSLRELMPYLT